MSKSKSGVGVEELFGRLQQQIKGHQNKRALKTIEEILKASPDDEDALQCKATLLIKSSKFEETLTLIADNKLANALAFEKAYCLYRLSRYAEALEALDAVAEEKVVSKTQLQAQLYYRQGKYGEAIDAYNQLVQKHKVATAEVHTNMLAAYISAGRAAEVPAVLERLKISGKESFDVAFNKACSMVEAGDYAAAEAQLLLAVRLGKELLMEEDAGEEETEEELAPIMVQLAYVAAQLGKHAEAVESYEAVTSRGLADEVTSTIAMNNLIAERVRQCKEKDVKRLAHECLKKMESKMDKAGSHNLKPSLETRLSAQQAEGLSLNIALLLLLGNRREAAADLLRSLSKRWPQSGAVGMARAALYMREGRSTEAEGVLAPLSSSSREATLLRAQLALSTANKQLALDLLEGIAAGGLGDKPAVLASRADLLEQLGRVEEARKVVEGALARMGPPARKGSRAPAGASGDQDGHVWLLQRAASLALQAGATGEALKRYRELEALDPKAAAASSLLSQLAAARLAEGDAVPLAADLPPLPALPPVEVDDLELAFLGSGKMRKHMVLRKRKSGTGEKPVAQHKRHKHKTRLPKNFDPDNPGPPPDPERWLPKWQRSDYKKKRARRKEKEGIKGSQGAGKVDESLDRTKRDPSSEPDPGGKSSRQPGPRASKKKGRR